MTPAELIGRTRVALDSPLGGHPSDRQLRDIVLEEAQHFQNRIRISQRRGDTKTIPFTLDPNVEKTLLNAPDLGVWVYAYAIDPLRSWNEPPIRLVDAANFDQLPREIVAVDPPYEIYGSLITENGVPYYWRRAKLSQSYQCVLIYEAGKVTMTGEQELPMPEHHNYLLARCIIKALPKAQWEQPDPARYGVDMAYSTWFDGKWRQKRKELAEPYVLALPELQATFDKETRRVQEPAVVTLSSGVGYEDLWGQ